MKSIARLLLSTITTFTATVALADSTAIQQVWLDDRVAVSVPVATNRVTTISFPGPIAAIDAAQASIDPQKAAAFLIAYTKGSSFLSVRAEAKKAIARGEDVECHRGVYRSPGDADIRVETLVLENGRAGQTTNGDAVWGDWDAETQTITADDGSVYDLDAGEIE